MPLCKPEIVIKRELPAASDPKYGSAHLHKTTDRFDESPLQYYIFFNLMDHSREGGVWQGLVLCHTMLHHVGRLTEVEEAEGKHYQGGRAEKDQRPPVATASCLLPRPTWGHLGESRWRCGVCNVGGSHRGKTAGAGGQGIATW